MKFAKNFEHEQYAFKRKIIKWKKKTRMGIDILFLYIDVKLFYITIFPRFIYKVFKIARTTQLKSNKIATFYRTNTWKSSYENHRYFFEKNCTILFSIKSFFSLTFRNVRLNVTSWNSCRCSHVSHSVVADDLVTK